MHWHGAFDQKLCVLFHYLGVFLLAVISGNPGEFAEFQVSIQPMCPNVWFWISWMRYRLKHSW